MNTARLIWNHRRRFLRKLEHAEHVWQAVGGHYFLLFAVGWLSCALPTWLYQTASYWLWPVLTGMALLLSAAITDPKTGLKHQQDKPHVQFFICSIVISIVLSLDFIHQVPDILLTLCSSNENNLLTHLVFHWQFFPLTSVTMLALVWLPQYAPSAAVRNNGNLRQNLAGNLALNLALNLAINLAQALGMFCMMAFAMRSVNLLCIALGLSLTADALASAMICGMLLYHLGAAKLQAFFKR